MKRIFLLACLALGIWGCTPSVSGHKLGQAIALSNQALSQLFFEQNTAATYALMHPDFKQKYGPEKLSSLQQSIQNTLGPVSKFRLKSYVALPGSSEVVLFYNASSLHSGLFIKVLLLGNADQGYLLRGIFASNYPYASEAGLQKIYKSIVIQSKNYSPLR